MNRPQDRPIRAPYSRLVGKRKENASVRVITFYPNLPPSRRIELYRMRRSADARENAPGPEVLPSDQMSTRLACHALRTCK